MATPMECGDYYNMRSNQIGLRIAVGGNQSSSDKVERGYDSRSFIDVEKWKASMFAQEYKEAYINPIKPLDNCFLK